MDDTFEWVNLLTFAINGRPVILRNIDPKKTLLSYLRETGLTGTKLGCGEGGCGACTVMISEYDRLNKSFLHKSVNACLYPLCNADGCNVVTIEGIGSTKTEMHPVQKRIAEIHGSQCGFCTPGIVMALYAFLRNNPKPTKAEIEESFDGNLCRCTGYRPILDAAKTFAIDSSAKCCKDSANSSGGCCKMLDSIEDCSTKFVVNGTPEAAAISSQISVVSCTCSKNELIQNGSIIGPSEPIFPAFLKKYEPKPLKLSKIDASFLPTTSTTTSTNHNNTNTSLTWYRPVTLTSLMFLKAKLGSNSKLVSGNTEVGIDTFFRGLVLKNIISLSAVKEMRSINVITDNIGGSIHVGGAVTLSELNAKCKKLEKSLNIHQARTPRSISTMLRWFASQQIRNVATLAGNIVNASPISDMNPLLVAMGATLIVRSDTGGERSIPIQKFFKSYRCVDINDTEVLIRIEIPLAKPLEFIGCYKQARRRDDDIAIVNGAFRIQLKFKSSRYSDDSSSNDASSARRTSYWEVTDASFGYGGMAAVTTDAKEAQNTLIGSQWAFDTLLPVYEAIHKDMNLPDNVPGGMAEYRMSLASSFLFKFFIKTCKDLFDEVASHNNNNSNNNSYNSNSSANENVGSADCNNDILIRHQIAAIPTVSPRMKNAGEFLKHERLSSGYQRYGSEVGGLQTTQAPGYYTPLENHNNINSNSSSSAMDKVKIRGPVGSPLAHASANLQVTGEALYTDDIPLPPGTLHAVLVLSTKPNAILKHVDPSKALSMDGVEAYYGASDITGSNVIGAVIQDEELFVTHNIVSVGQAIGVVVAQTLAQAQAAVRVVDVQYGEREYVNENKDDINRTNDTKNTTIISIQDAIKANACHPMGHTCENGENIDLFFKTIDDNNINTIVSEDKSSNLIVVEGEVNIGGQEHFYLEPNVTLVVPSESGLSVHASTQNPTKTQRFVARVLGLPESKVVCHVKRLGGGFGGKETRSVFISCAAAVAAHKLNAPVKICLSRDVDMSITGQRHAFYGKYKVAATPEGKLMGLDMKLYNNGGYSLDLSAAVMDRAIFHCTNAYKIPNIRCSGFVCRTNTSSNTAFRGFGGPQGMCVAETFMEHIAHELNMDVNHLRRQNLLHTGDRLHYGQVLKNVELKRSWDELLVTSSYVDRVKTIKQYNKENRYRKRGISMIPTAFGINFTAKFMNQGSALVHLYTDGTVLVSHGGTEMGQGLHTKMCQIAARVFGISVKDVHIDETATDKCANQSPTAASVSSDMYGMAVLNACEKINQRLKNFRKKLPNDASLKELANAAYFERVNLSAHGFFAIPQCGYDWDLIDVKSNEERGTPFSYHTYGVAVSEVEIDTLTGDMQVIRADVLMDVGASLNAAIDIGQIEGAYVQGMGWCTMEELIWGDDSHKWIRTGNLFTKGPGTYKIPSFNDVPVDFRVSLLENAKNDAAVHSSKAVGEPPFFLASSVFFACKNAVRAARDENKSLDSSKFFYMDLPATAERIRMGCEDVFTARVTAKGFRPKGSY